MVVWRLSQRRRPAAHNSAPFGKSVFGVRLGTDFLILSVFIVLLFVAGGGARADMLSLVLLRPIAVLLAAWWAVRLQAEHLAGHRWLVLIPLAVAGLVAMHLVPLAPTIWQSLPGHEIIARVDRTAELGQLWRPLTIAPDATRNALFSLTVPIAVALGLLHLNFDERRALLPLLIGIATASLLLALAQDAAPGVESLWLHRVTNAGDPVGLFANRNHNAVFLACLPLLLVVWAFDADRPRRAAMRKALAAVISLLTVVAIIVAGSRAGLVALGLTLAGTLSLIPKPEKGPNAGRFGRWVNPIRIGLASALVLIAAIGVTYIVRSGGEGAAPGGSVNAIDRLSTSSSDDFRVEFWSRTVSLIPDYLPFGSGAGSFVEAYQLGQPEDTVGPNYVNHAHNDYLEVALTLGIPGVILISAILTFLTLRAVPVWRTPPERRRSVYLARASSLALGVLAIASIVDYPARVPSIAAFAVILVVWLCQPRAGAKAETGSAMAFTNRLG